MRRDMLPWHHHPGHPGVVVPVRIDPAGRRGPTPEMARGSRWRRVGPGWFVPAGVDGADLDQRIVEAAVHLTSYGAVTGWGALHWRGARWAGGVGRPVQLATGDAGIRPAAGLTISEERLLPWEIEVVDGLRITRPARSALYEMRWAPDLGRAVTALDMACYDDLVSIDEATTLAETLATWTGIPQAREALALADENAWSPAEVGARLLWQVDAGLPRPLTNRPIFDLAGRLVRTPDLIDPLAGVVLEHDGDVHVTLGSKRGDVRRDDLYRRHGLEQVTTTAADLADPGAAIRRLHEAYARAMARPSADRSWTVSPPRWWTPTGSVTQRRMLTGPERRRALRYRDAA